MKHLIIILSTAISFAAKGQNLGMGIGVNSHGIPNWELFAQAGKRPFVRGGYIASLSRTVKEGVFINAQTGWQFQNNNYYFEPAIGYCYAIRSNDRKDLNTRGMIYSFTTGKYINGNCVHLRVAFSQNVWMSVLGIAYNF